MWLPQEMWVASNICAPDMFGTKLHDIWPWVQLGRREAREAAMLATGAFISDA